VNAQLQRQGTSVCDSKTVEHHAAKPLIDVAETEAELLPCISDAPLEESMMQMHSQKEQCQNS
jgi:hypothetical protein